MVPPYSISVVLPALNEEENLPATVADAIAHLNRLTRVYEIIIVNDGSSDRTQTVAERLCIDNPGVREVSHASNRGYGAAVRSGFLAARCDLIFLTDADGQFSFRHLPEFYSGIGDFDAVIGYRAPRADPRHRLLISFVGNWFARQFFGLHARDIDCAFKLIRRDALRGISLGCDGTMISTELLARAGNAGWRIKELPVPHQPRKHGVATGAKPAFVWRTIVEFFSLLHKQKRQLRANSNACASRC